MVYINLSNSKISTLSYLNEEDAKEQSQGKKGWSFSYVYHFSELKDIYLILKTTEFKRPKKIFENLRNLNLKYEKTPWEERRILEQINALKNFGLIDENNNVCKDEFQGSIIGSPISEEDLKVFKNIYFSYFRFREMHSWFININSTNRVKEILELTQEKAVEDSRILFPFFLDSRFTDAFLLELKDSTEIFYIDKSNEDLMRFWDVYVKWGQSLGVLEKFSLKELDYELSKGNKSLSCVYFKKHYDNNFDLFTFIKEEYKSKYIQVPKLIFKIAIKHRFSIEQIKKIIIEQSLANNNHISLQRTSEIFIRNKGKVLFPKYRDSYISHLMIQY